MKEATFYDIMEKMENAQMPSGMGKYYPTVNDLQLSLQGRKTEDLLPVLMYYANDPYKGIVTDRAYLDTVLFAKKLSSSIPLE